MFTMSQGTKIATRNDTKMKQTSVPPIKVVNASVEAEHFLEKIYLPSGDVDSYINIYNIWYMWWDT